MTHTPGTRQVQKQATHQAFLDAALELLEEQSLSSLGLREVTRAVGVVPTAFYRHFRDTADLGVELVEQALGSLHAMIREALAETGGEMRAETSADRTVGLIADLVRTSPAHVRFVSRERHGGVRRVREAIGAQLLLFADEVAAAFAREPESAGWSEEDLRMLAGVYVDHLVMTACAFLEAGPAGHEGEEHVRSVARRQLRLISLGRRHWLD